MGYRLRFAVAIAQATADYDTIEKAFRDGVGKTRLIPDTKLEVAFERRRPPLATFAAEVRAEICAVVTKYRGLRDSELKTKVYLTGPMKRILRQEKDGKANLYNSPIDMA